MAAVTISGRPGRVPSSDSQPPSPRQNSRSVNQEHAAAGLKKPMKPSFQPAAKQLKRPMPTAPPAPIPSKKPRVGVLKDVTLAEAGKVASLNEYAFFDQVSGRRQGGLMCCEDWG